MNGTRARPLERLRELVASLLVPQGDGAIIRRNVGWLIADKVARLAVSLVVNVWIVRYLGASNLGLLSFSQSTVALFAIVSQLGIESILVRDLVRRPQDAATLLGSSFGLRFAGAAVTLVASLAALMLLRPGDHEVLAMGAVFAGLSFFSALDVIEYWFQSRSRVTPFVVARAVAFVVATGARILALVLHASLVVLAAAIAVEFALAGLLLLLAYRREAGAPAPWRFRLDTARQLLRDSWPLMLNGAAALLALRIDQTMLTLMRGAHENGIYAAAQRLTEVLFVVPLAVVGAAAPALLRSHGADRGEYWRRFGRVYSVVTWIGVLIALPVSVLGPWITHRLFGPEFAASGIVLAIHIWSVPALFAGVVQTNWFIAEGRQRALMVRSIVACGMNVGLNLWLIPAWGARGAALATLVSLTFAYILFNGLFPSTRRLFRLQLRAFLPMLAADGGEDDAGRRGDAPDPPRSAPR